MRHITDNRGVSLLLTLLIMAVLLVIAFGVSRLSLGEIRLAREVPKSLIGYYAAEAGIEAAIYEDLINYGGVGTFSLSGCVDSPNNKVCYSVDVSGSSPNRAIRSNGSYKDIRRAIELTY